MAKSRVDLSSVFKGLDGMKGIGVSLARSMCVAGGQVVRDEAKVRAPVGSEEGGSIAPGTLRDALYVAYKDRRSLSTQVVYSVTWNAKKAPHGHLLEFGHWQFYQVVHTPTGWFTDTSVRLANPKWVPAEPFLRPALEASRQRAHQAMLERGRQRLPELIRDMYASGDSFV